MNLERHSHVHSDASARRRDPCGCGDLRSRLETYLRKAVSDWQRDIRIALVDGDSLSLGRASGASARPQDRLDRLTSFVVSSAAHRFQAAADKLTGTLVFAYTRGVNAAFTEAGKRLVTNPTNAGLYVQQAANDLRGIVEETTKLINRAAATGLAAGDSTSKLYRAFVPAFRDVALPRTRLLASTLVTTAYNGGKIDTFEMLGVKVVGIVAEDMPKRVVKDAASFYKRGSRSVVVEWVTAGDELVCPICEELEGSYYTLAAARGLIPRHPNCRCTVELVSDFT